jgi:hypothetical protein
MRSFRGALAGPLAAVVASLALTGCVTDEAVESPRPAILPIDGRVYEGLKVEKWLRPVRVSVTGESTAAQRDYVAQQVNWLSAVTNHDLAMGHGPRGDIQLVFGKEMPETALAQHADVFAPLYSSDAAMTQDLRSNNKRALCIAKLGMSAENPHEIVYAAGLIPAELNRVEFEQCVVRQLLTALGSKISAIGPIKSPANPGKYGNYTSILNVVDLSVLYDPRVKPGMTDEEVEPIRSDNIQQMLKTGQN